MNIPHLIQRLESALIRCKSYVGGGSTGGDSEQTRLERRSFLHELDMLESDLVASLQAQGGAGEVFGMKVHTNSALPEGVAVVTDAAGNQLVRIEGIQCKGPGAAAVGDAWGWAIEFSDPDPQFDVFRGSECPEGWARDAFPLYRALATPSAPVGVEGWLAALREIARENTAEEFEEGYDRLQRLAREALAAAVSVGDAKDGQRFRDLCELVEYGELGVCIVNNDDVPPEYMDGVADIPPMIDARSELAAMCRNARERDAAIASKGDSNG